MKSPNHKSTKDAWGLVEILISMVIFGIGIITISSLNAKNYRTVKNNELIDQANLLMVSALDDFKSPDKALQDTLSTSLTAYGVTANFSLNPSTIDPISTTDWSWLLRPPTTPFTDCLSSPVYRVTFKNPDGTDNAFPLCLRVQVTRGANGYKIVSHIKYVLNGQNLENQIIGYRPLTYVQ